MKRTLPWLILLAGAALLIGSCANPLASRLPADVVISLGLIGGADGFEADGVTPINGASALRAAQGAAFSVPVLICESQGRPLAGTYTVSFSLSADDDPTTGTDYPLGTAEVAAGAETMVTLTVGGTVPANLAPGYNLIAYFPVAAGDPGRAFASSATAYYNASMRTIEIAAAADALPDLAIAVRPFAAPFQAPSSQAPVGFVIRNSGYAGIAAGTAIRVRAFADSIAGDPDVGTQTLTLAAPLLPQGIVTGSVTVTLPALETMAVDYGVTAAQLDLWEEDFDFVVDPDGAIAEIDEANNAAYLECVSGNAKANAGIHGIVLPSGQSAFKRGGSAQGQVAVELVNYGVVAIDAYAVRLYVDNGATPGEYDSGDAVVQTWTPADTPNLAPTTDPGNIHTATLTATAAAAWPDVEGSFTLRAMVFDSVGEYSFGDTEAEDNALGFFGPGRGITLLPSLVNLKILNMVSSLDAPLPASGGALSVSLLAQNDGSETLETDFSVAFYLSADNNLVPAGDTALGSPVTVTESIAPKGKRMVNANLTVPASANGFYTLYAFLDSAAAVTEMDETDNSPADAQGICVYVPVCDGVGTLAARALFYVPGGATIGDQLIQAESYDYTNGAYSVGFTSFASGPKGRYGSFVEDYDPAITYGIDVSSWWGPSYYAFRLVPVYVSEVPASSVPSTVGGQEATEGPTDSWAAATPLNGPSNPWCNWIVGYVYDTLPAYERYDYHDYYRFDL